MMPPTPLQNSNDTVEEEHWASWVWKIKCEVRKKERSLQERKSVKVEFEELEDLLGPDDVDVDFGRILKEARYEGLCETFETFSTDGLSEFLVASRSLWDKYTRKWDAPWRQNSSTVASEGWWQK